MQENDEKKNLEEKVPFEKFLYFMNQVLVFFFYSFFTICAFDIILDDFFDIFGKSLNNVFYLIGLEQHPRNIILADVKWKDLLYVYIITGSVVTCFSLSIAYNPLIIYLVKKIKILKKYVFENLWK